MHQIIICKLSNIIQPFGILIPLYKFINCTNPYTLHTTSIENIKKKNRHAFCLFLSCIRSDFIERYTFVICIAAQ